MTRSRRPPSPSGRLLGRPGFTLIELICVVALLGVILLLVPPQIDGAGARTRLESRADTLSSVLTAAKEQAIIDGHEVILEYHLYDSPAEGGEKWSGWRYVISSLTHDAPESLDPSQAGQARARPPQEDEWVETPWERMPNGVRLSAFSVNRGEWQRAPGNTIRVSFFPDGSVRPAHALRVESTQLPRDVSVMTVRVNALTALAEVIDGEADLTVKRDPSDFR